MAFTRYNNSSQYGRDLDIAVEDVRRGRSRIRDLKNTYDAMSVDADKEELFGVANGDLANFETNITNLNSGLQSAAINVPIDDLGL